MIVKPMTIKEMLEDNFVRLKARSVYLGKDVLIVKQGKSYTISGKKYETFSNLDALIDYLKTNEMIRE